MERKYDIFISYKHIQNSRKISRKLYDELITRGYSTFWDDEEMHRGNFEIQLYNYIENSKDIFIIIERGSLEAFSNGGWETDWFCKEIVHSLKKEKNIIPVLIDGYKMPKIDDFSFADNYEMRMLLSGLLSTHSPDFMPKIDEYIDRLINKNFIISRAMHLSTIFIKSDMNCKVNCGEGSTGSLCDLYKNKYINIPFNYRTGNPIEFKFTVDGIKYFKIMTIVSEDYGFLNAIDVKLKEDYENKKNIDRNYRNYLDGKYTVNDCNEYILQRLSNIHLFNKILKLFKIR